jgi:hypothetical protein
VKIAFWPNCHFFNSRQKMSSAVTPARLAEYERESKARLDKLLAILNDKSWTESKKEPDITFYTRTDPSSDFSQLKSIVSIPAPIEVVLEALKPIEPVNSKTPEKERHGLVERKVLYGPSKDGSETSIFYFVVDSPAPLISAREFLVFRKLHQLPGGTYSFFHHSVTIPELCPENKDYVRGDMLFQGYLAEPDPDHAGSVRLTFFVHADARGSVPAWVVNKTITNQGYAAKGIKKVALAKLGKK